jgi:putative thiamine transport system substrate-binding protein
MKRLLVLLLLATVIAARPALADSTKFDWAQIVAAARGQTVYFNAWGGSERINDYIAWAGDRVAAD